LCSIPLDFRKQYLITHVSKSLDAHPRNPIQMVAEEPLIGLRAKNRTSVTPGAPGAGNGLVHGATYGGKFGR